MRQPTNQFFFFKKKPKHAAAKALFGELLTRAAFDR